MTAVSRVFQALDAMHYTFQVAKANEAEFPDIYEGVDEDRQLLIVTSLSLLSPAVTSEATLVWVSADMVDLLRHAARTLPPYDFSPSVLPWPHAICVAEKPLMQGEIKGGPFSVTAATWFTTPNTAVIAPLSNHHYGGRCLSPILSARLQTGLSWPDATRRDDLVDEAKRLCCTLWLLLQQRVAVKRIAHLDRPAKRRWERENDRPIPEVIVVELRKPISVTDNEHEYNPVDWSHRWIVDGHWKNQWHPSTSTHVPTWIAPYVKGPDDKPLVVKRKVNAWVR